MPAEGAGDDAGEKLVLPGVYRSQYRVGGGSFRGPSRTKRENLVNSREEISVKLGSFKHSDIPGGKHNSPSKIERAAKAPNVANHAMLPKVSSQNYLEQQHHTIP